MSDHRRAQGLAITLLAVVVVLLLWLKPDPFGASTTVHARFADVSGLAAVGADVRIGGVKVGEVTDRSRAPGGAELTMELDGDAPAVHGDARAALRPTLLFEGRAYVDLDPGARGAARTIPLARTTTYVPLADVLEVLDRGNATKLRAVVAGGTRNLTPDASAALNATLRAAPQLTATLSRTARAARGARGTELRSAVRHLSATTDAVALRADDLPPLVRSSERTARGLDAGGALGTALAALPATVGRLRTGSAALQRTVEHLRPLARELRPALREAVPTVDALRPVLRRAAPALSRATPLLRDLRTGLDAARPAALPTRRLLAAAQPSVDLLDRSLLDALERRTALGTPAYLAFLGLFAGGGGASRPFGIGGTEGHFMRFGFRFITGLAAPLPPCDLLSKASPQLADLFSAAGGCTP